LADQFLGCASHLIVTLKTKLERNKALLLLHRTQKPVLDPAPGSPVSYWLALHEDVNKLVLQSGTTMPTRCGATTTAGRRKMWRLISGKSSRLKV
jgi:hypothetical protein